MVAKRRARVTNTIRCDEHGRRMRPVSLSDSESVSMSARRDAKESQFLLALERCVKETSDEDRPKYVDGAEAVRVLLEAKGAPVGTVAALSRLHPELPAMLLDVACVLDAAADAKEERADLCHLLREAEAALSDKLLKERLEIDTLQDVGTLKNKNFYTKFIKIKTKLYYKQRKFNLFREESEGYAKLIVELNQETEEIDPKNVLEIIKSLIGRFNLDPNRVLDIILESFESRYDNENLFIPLIKSYMSDPQIVCEVLGFKFASYSDENAPHGLYIVTALLLQYKIISLNDIYSWLRPDDSIIWKESEQEMREAQEYVRRMTIICTNKQPGDNEPETKENTSELVVDLNNQKLRLGAALLEIGCWDVFDALSSRLPEYRASAYPPATKALCTLLHSVIHPLYLRYCPIAPNIKTKPITQLKNKLAVPCVQELTDMKLMIIPALASLGPALHTDPVLMYKIVRLCKAARAISNDPLRHDILSILDSAILPALSYMDCNCCMAEEVYSLLKLYAYQYRYCLYARWKNEAPLRHASLLRRRADAQRQIKAIMKRVSKENVKPQGRLIGKLSHAAPAFFFDYVLLQIQIYDNLIGPVVESLKYLTSLSYDMLGYCLVEALGGGKRARVQPDGASAAPWLQGLAAFCGAACKKYAIDLTALLQFVANQLKAKKSLDLLILKEIVQKMAGIEAAEEMTSEQLDAMSGGELLRGEAGYFSQVRNTKKSSQRLKEALVNGGEGLDAALCLLAAQQRQCCAYREDGAEGAPRAHLKLVGRLIDQCQDALVQFGVFLATTHTHDEYSARIPSIDLMLCDYHIGADVAFFLARPALSWSIMVKYEKVRRENSDGKRITAATKQQRYAEAASIAMAPVVSAIKSTLPAKTWDDISPQLYVTFWSLTMYDLLVPIESYKREIDKLKVLAASAGSDGNNSTSNMAKGRKEHEKYNTLMDKLQDEKRKQHEHVERVMFRLQQEKDTWFLSRSSKYAKDETITQFMQLCLFPRCLFTAMDAIYCAHFLHMLHSFKTANFPTLLCYDRLFCDITYTVTCLTEGEAARYGRFLEAVLATANHWLSDENIFEQECAHYPGFVTKFRCSNKFSDSNDHINYDHFKLVSQKWHFKITKALVFCLESRNYVQIRNSLIVLIRLLPQFPITSRICNFISTKIEKVCAEEKNQRQDLYILATSYSGQLKARIPSKLHDEDFSKSKESKTTNTSNNTSNVNGDSQNDKDSKRDIGKDRKLFKNESFNEKDSKKDTNQPFKSNNSERRSGETSKDWDVRSNNKSNSRDDETRRNKERTSNDRNFRDDHFLEAVSPATGTNIVSDDVLLLNSANNVLSRSQQDSSDRETKRRKVDENSTLKGSKDRERESSPIEKRTRGGSKSGIASRSSSNTKLRGPDDREARKERKLGRKRERTDESIILEQKRRRDEQKSHQNGEQDDHHLEKHHHKREKSPYRDRSHERQESRDKQSEDQMKISYEDDHNWL